MSLPDSSISSISSSSSLSAPREVHEVKKDDDANVVKKASKNAYMNSVWTAQSAAYMH